MLRVVAEIAAWLALGAIQWAGAGAILRLGRLASERAPDLAVEAALQLATLVWIAITVVGAYWLAHRWRR